MYHFQKKTQRNNGLGLKEGFVRSNNTVSRVYKQPFVLEEGGEMLSQSHCEGMKD